MKEVVSAFIDKGGDFEEVALRLFRWQRAHNAEYDRFSGSANPMRWEDIPAVPVSLFQDLAFTCYPPEQARIHFRTSGTTRGVRGVHRLRDTEVYDLGARRHAEACLGRPLPAYAISLVTPSADSSLDHMCRSFAPETRRPDSTAHALALLRAVDRPVFVPGTAFAFADLVAAAGRPCPLPEGSVVMVTGGFKGHEVTVPQDELGTALARLLPGALLVGEYGMTELSSQLWSVPLGTPFRPPPWLRVRAVHPWTCETTDRGLLRFGDLANHQTVLAIETEDVGEVRADGSVVLLGRLAGATPRGCSLTVEEARA